MDIFPVVCGLLSFLLIGPSDAKVITLKLGSAIKGERINFDATCKGPCKGVRANVTADSGFPLLYGRNGSLPHPGDCDDCLCSDDNVCGNISFQCSESIAISVVAYTDFEHATLTVEATNLDMITKITLPSERLNLGSVKRGKRRNFKVTCYGPCEQFSAFVRGTSGRPFLYGAENSWPLLDDDSRCTDCFCESIAHWWVNICQFKSLKHSSTVYISVTAETDYKNAFLKVETVNFKNIEEIVSTSKLLNLSSSRVGLRSNFYITCDGPCREVHVKAVSGNPKLLLAKSFIPFMQGSRCKNCLEEVNDYTFKDSNSFGLTVPTTTLGDIVKVTAANLKDIKEIIYPSKTFDIGYMRPSERKEEIFTCNGPCKELRVYATYDWFSGRPYWYVSNPRVDDPDINEKCTNCICAKTKYTENTCDFISLDDISTFFLLLRAYPILPVRKVKLFVEGFNLKVKTETAVIS